MPASQQFAKRVIDAGSRSLMHVLGLFLECLLQATSGARNPNLQVVITHASHVCSLHSFEPLLRMNGLHRAQFGHARLDVLSLVI